MTRFTHLGELERSVMDQLWNAPEPQTVRQVHAKVSAHRHLAYNTVLTVLRRLTDKGYAVRQIDVRPHRYAPGPALAELVAATMIQALQQAGGGDHFAVLAHFVGQVGCDEVRTLRRVLGESSYRATVPEDAPVTVGSSP